MMSGGRGRHGGALKAKGSSARSDGGQLSGQLMSLVASLIELKHEHPAKFRRPVEKSFQTERPEQEAPNSSTCLHQYLCLIPRGI